MTDSPNLDSLDAWTFDVRRVEKPWGYELIWAHTDIYVGKVLFVRAGQSLSLQFHREKDESWLVQSGRAKLELGEAGESVLKEEVVGPGAEFHYRPGTVHRVTALEDTTILEVSTPHLDDVVRLEAAYGREGTSAPSPRCGKVGGMESLTVGRAAAETGWSARMLRYLEEHGLVRPQRSDGGYRLYGLAELNRLRALRDLRQRFRIDPSDLAFALRLRREPELRKAVDGWLAAADDTGSWIDWEQRKHERLLAA